MSSKSKSSSSSAQSTATTDARVVADNGAIVVRDGDVSIIDGGAFEFAGDVVEGNFDLLEDAISEAFKTSEGIADIGAEIAFDSLGFAREVTEQNQDVLQDAFGFVNGNLADTNQLVEKIVDQQRSESTQLAGQLIKLGIPAVALVLIAGALRK